MQEEEVGAGGLWVCLLWPGSYILGPLLPDMVTTLKPAITQRCHPSELSAWTTDSPGFGNSSICLSPFRESLESHHSGSISFLHPITHLLSLPPSLPPSLHPSMPPFPYLRASAPSVASSLPLGMGWVRHLKLVKTIDSWRWLWTVHRERLSYG